MKKSKSKLDMMLKELKVSGKRFEDEYNYIYELCDVIHERGIVLLDPMKINARRQVHDIIKTIPDIKSFNIGYGEYKRVVLKSSPYDPNVDCSECLKLGEEAYLSKDYNTCIQYLREVIKVSKPDHSVFAKVGISYMKLSYIETAIDYLTVAEELSKKEDNNKEIYSDLIRKLKNDLSTEKNKSQGMLTESYFESIIDEYYNLDNINEIAKLVLSGVAIETACEKFSLVEEEKAIAFLIYAMELYSQENYLLADNLMKRVEKMKNKTSNVKELYKEILKNKKFYKNRTSKKSRSLIFIPQQ